MRSCEWLELKKQISYHSSLSSFIGKKKITGKQLLDAVQLNDFFGVIKVDLKSPQTLIDKYKFINFPFIFNPVTITEDMVSPEMLKRAKNNGRKFPYSCMTLTYNAENFIATTPLLQFYLSIGMQVTKIHWAIEYIPSKPFSNFVKEMVEIRIQSAGSNAPLGDRFCDYLNLNWFLS